MISLPFKDRLAEIKVLLDSYTTAEFQAAIQSGELKYGNIVYVSDAGVIAYIKADGAIASIPCSYGQDEAPYISLSEVFRMLGDHIENDKGYWATLQQVLNNVGSLQALMMKLQASHNDLMTRVAVLEDLPEPLPEPVYDMTAGLVLHTPPLIGLLGIEILGVDLIGNGWSAPSDGLIVVDNASVIGLLTPTWIAVDGVKADPTGTVVLQLIGGTDSANIDVQAGQVITQSGMGNITFYKRIS